MGDKRFKDPIYGYIEIEEEWITKVIDTPAFQRLRDVIQTSYAPLYSSAVHNRFVHSLGVYHLGRIAATAFLNSLGDKSLPNFSDINQYVRIFELACLLHDVGHAPFSHTGEKFYMEKGERTGLHNRILELTNDHELEEEIRVNSYKAAPHELMSAIVSLQEFESIIPGKVKSFFARCIIGYKYVNGMDTQKSLMNCLIELLNSKIIDVDKLDYLLRDSYMTGFDTIKIDYIRLLKSICIIADKQQLYRICYNKAAVSVLENVVYAHDAERKWIQNHPIVLYDAYLGENALDQVMRWILKCETLSDKFLSEKGVEIEKLGRVRLMGDSDVHYLMKNLVEGCAYVKEYYDRNLRKHPLWKTEAEFQAIFLGHEKELIVIEEEFDSLRNFLRTQGIPFIINSAILSIYKWEIDKTQELMEQAEGFARERYKASLEIKNRHVKWMKILEEFAANQGIDFDFQIIYTNQFNSGFRKQEFGNIELIFPELKNPCKFEEVSTILTSQKSKGEKFFYLYYKRKDEKQTIKINELITQMLIFASEIRLKKSLAEKLL